MKLSPSFPSELMFFGFSLLKALLSSAIIGFVFFIIFKQLRKAINEQKSFRIWLYLSLSFFALYVFFLGI